MWWPTAHIISCNSQDCCVNLSGPTPTKKHTIGTSSISFSRARKSRSVSLCASWHFVPNFGCLHPQNLPVLHSYLLRRVYLNYPLVFLTMKKAHRSGFTGHHQTTYTASGPDLWKKRSSHPRENHCSKDNS